jgi:hypothetical protein
MKRPARQDAPEDDGIGSILVWNGLVTRMRRIGGESVDATDGEGLRLLYTQEVGSSILSPPIRRRDEHRGGADRAEHDPERDQSS